MKRLRSPGSSRPIDLTDPNTPISLLEHEFRSFCNEVMPMSVGTTQLNEAQRAFYAGAQAVLNVLDGAFAEGLPPEECGKVLPAIGVEINRYAARLGARSKGKDH